jgi:hypothetical protein
MPDVLGSTLPLQYAILPFEPALVACAGSAANNARLNVANHAAQTFDIPPSDSNVPRPVSSRTRCHVNSR